MYFRAEIFGRTDILFYFPRAQLKNIPQKCLQNVSLQDLDDCFERKKDKKERNHFLNHSSKMSARGRKITGGDEGGRSS